MRSILRRWLGTLSADEIEALINRALMKSDTTVYLDGDQVARIADRRIARHMDLVARASYGKD